jgi:geranylgeranyl transferase type-2 subunit beta
MPGYLEQLTLRLTMGIGELSEAQRALHANYFLSAQRADGGFAGREGGSDLYYTSFGLRALAILGELRGSVAKQAAAFLKSRLRGEESVVDFFSLIYAGRLLELAAGVEVFSQHDTTWKLSVANWLNTLRRDDGGFAKAPAGNASSTYHTFLAMLCLQLIDQPLPDPEKIVTFLNAQHSQEGGFLEIRAQKRAGTNPTAAAIATLHILDKLSNETKEETIDFLLDLHTDEGGFRANTRIPIADLLSTFTALLTLRDLGAWHEVPLDDVKKYVASLQTESGGFQGAAWDTAHDVEYSFYGLACLSLLHLAPE